MILDIIIAIVVGLILVQLLFLQRRLENIQNGLFSAVAGEGKGASLASKIGELNSHLKDFNQRLDDKLLVQNNEIGPFIANMKLFNTHYNELERWTQKFVRIRSELLGIVGENIELIDKNTQKSLEVLERNLEVLAKIHNLRRDSLIYNSEEYLIFRSNEAIEKIVMEIKDILLKPR